jgi:hypothetical protein
MSDTRTKAIVDLLCVLDEVEWARCVGSDEPLYPPYCVWRFKHPKSEIEMAIVDAVKSYVGATEWTINKGRRNWVIEPLAFERFARSFRVDVEAGERFAAEHPAETRTALSDVVTLTDHLRHILLPH